MIKIRLFCSGGMLSSVIVNKMTDAAKLRELEVDIQAFSESKMSKVIDGVDVVLLGPQIAYKFPKIKLMCEPLGIATNIISMRDLGMMNGNNILDMAFRSIEEMKERLEGESSERKEQEVIGREISKREASEKETQEMVESDIKEKEPKEMIKRDIKESEVAEVTIYNQISKLESKDYKINDILNVKAYDNMLKKAKKLILSAEKDIYISSNIDIIVFKDEIIEISQRGVRLTVVSLKKYDSEELPIDKLYTYIDENNNKNLIIMIVVDDNKALVANNIGEDEISDVVIDNQLLVSVVLKNILNNIYLLKLRDNIAFKLKDM